MGRTITPRPTTGGTTTTPRPTMQQVLQPIFTTTMRSNSVANILLSLSQQPRSQSPSLEKPAAETTAAEEPSNPPEPKLGKRSRLQQPTRSSNKHSKTEEDSKRF